MDQSGFILRIGVFFDGSGNNALNIDRMINICTDGNFSLGGVDARSLLERCGEVRVGVAGLSASSYTRFYTNIHWLKTLYKTDIFLESGQIQQALYIEGIGTDAGKPDNLIGLGMGANDTGVIAKTDKCISQLAQVIRNATQKLATDTAIVGLQFDLFGFSRGAAASCHFANRISSKDSAIIEAIRQGLGKRGYAGEPAGEIRFIGLFDAVTAIGLPSVGRPPQSANTGSVKIPLHPGVAQKVFHITAQNECRRNYPLHSFHPVWPELALPGVHSDIGGGYLPQETENLYLSRPAAETIPLEQPGEETQVYRLAMNELKALVLAPTVSALVRTKNVASQAWFDDRMPQDRYGNLQKRSFAAVTLRDRVVKNDWSKVALRIMLDAAQEAGVIFNPIVEGDKDLLLPSELLTLCDKAITQGKSARADQEVRGFTNDEIDVITKNYIHCSANWNSIVTDTKGLIQGGMAVTKLIGFPDRPDENWRRTVYNMYGQKQRVK